MSLSDPSLSRPAREQISDEALLELVQRQTFRYFWDFGHPVSGLARDRTASPHDLVAIGGSGMAVMCLIVAAERGWITRDQAATRLGQMLDVLERAETHHGALPHFMNGATGATIPFSEKDDGGDLVETALLMQGLLCARQYFHEHSARLDALWRAVDWQWYSRGRNVLYWHWSPRHGFVLNHEIRGWNECLIAYVLAVASPTHPVAPTLYHEGYAKSPVFRNGLSYYGIELPLGPPLGGPLFFEHYSFLGLDPRGLRDRYADYWAQAVAHTRINHAHCVKNPRACAGYGPECWGLTASVQRDGYAAHAPDCDSCVIAPTAALSSFPYCPELAMPALRHFFHDLGDRLWRPQGFADAFCLAQGWVSEEHLAIDQGPIIVMIENYRSGLLWRLFMSCPEIQASLDALGFSYPVVSA